MAHLLSMIWEITNFPIIQIFLPTQSRKIRNLELAENRIIGESELSENQNHNWSFSDNTRGLVANCARVIVCVAVSEKGPAVQKLNYQHTFPKAIPFCEASWFVPACAEMIPAPALSCSSVNSRLFWVASLGPSVGPV